MANVKIVVSGVSAQTGGQYLALVEAVRGRIEPDVRQKVDGSVLGRFAITELLNRYSEHPEQLATKLGFEVKDHE